MTAVVTMLLKPSSLVGVRVVVARGLARGRRGNLSTTCSNNTSSVNKGTSTVKQYNSCCCLLPNITTKSLERVSSTSSSSSLSFSTKAREAGFCFAAAARADKVYLLQQRNFTNNHVAVRDATRSFGTNKKVSPFANSNASAKTIKDGKTTNRSTKKKALFVPPKAAVKLTERSRSFLKQLLQSKIESEDDEQQLNQSGTSSTNTTKKKTVGIMLRYEQASDGQPRMVFKFDFVSSQDIDPKMGDEGVSLEVLEDGITPKSPTDAWDDQLPKLYIHHGAFLKVLGATIDIEPNTGDIILFDKEGHRLDPNV